MSAAALLRYVNNIERRRFQFTFPQDHPIPGDPPSHPRFASPRESAGERSVPALEKTRILVVEDDSDIANLLQIYFRGQGYEVVLAGRGCEALSAIQDQLPNLIVLDILLPDVDGYSLCAELRNALRTSRIPIIFLTQKDSRSDKITGLELGADDYVTKPFDIEELRLRIQNAITRARIESLTDPRTGLPTNRVIEDQLQRLIQLEDWALIDCGINYFDEYRRQYGYVLADEALCDTASLIDQVSAGFPDTGHFVGHTGGDNFLIITSCDCAEQLMMELRGAFQRSVGRHYTDTDRQRGYLIPQRNGQQALRVPLMSLSLGLVSSSCAEFSDSHSILLAAAEARQQDAPDRRQAADH